MLYGMEHPVTSNTYNHLSDIDDIAMEESKSNYGDAQNGVNVALQKLKRMQRERMNSFQVVALVHILVYCTELQ
eukprot:2026480-Ditylum_brightwellii.AAC.2